MTVFALHLDTTGGTEYSADYPFYLDRSTCTRLGDDFISIFGAGTCGDINHIDVSTNRLQKGGEEAQRIGKTLGETALIAIQELKTANTTSLAVGSYEVVNSRVQSGGREMLVEAAARLLKELKR